MKVRYFIIQVLFLLTWNSVSSKAIGSIIKKFKNTDSIVLLNTQKEIYIKTQNLYKDLNLYIIKKNRLKKVNLPDSLLFEDFKYTITNNHLITKAQSKLNKNIYLIVFTQNIINAFLIPRNWNFENIATVVYYQNDYCILLDSGGLSKIYQLNKRTFFNSFWRLNKNSSNIRMYYIENEFYIPTINDNLWILYNGKDDSLYRQVPESFLNGTLFKMKTIARDYFASVYKEEDKYLLMLSGFYTDLSIELNDYFDCNKINITGIDSIICVDFISNGFVKSFYLNVSINDIKLSSRYFINNPIGKVQDASIFRKYIYTVEQIKSKNCILRYDHLAPN